VRTDPAGAAVYVDGKFIGFTPATVKTVDVRRSHRLSIQRPGYREVERLILPGTVFESAGDHVALLIDVQLKQQEADANAPRTPAAAPSDGSPPAGESTPPAPAASPAQPSPSGRTADGGP
jgi:hypothetical protein